MKNQNHAKEQRLQHLIVTQVFSLATTSLGLIAALAWNEAIKEYVDIFVKPYLAKGSGVLSLFIYALIITIISVVVTVQTTKLLNRLDSGQPH